MQKNLIKMCMVFWDILQVIGVDQGQVGGSGSTSAGP
jgi:hypothetical protein